MFCEDCGVQFKKETDQVCGSCGASKAETTIKGSALHQKVIHLADQLKDENLDTRSIDRILSEHEMCFQEELCDVCEIWEENGLPGHVLQELASKSNATSEQQHQFTYWAWIGYKRAEGVFIALAKNPKISDESKKLLIRNLNWGRYGPNFGERLQGVVDTMRANVRFTDKEVTSFVKMVHRTTSVEVF